MLEKQSTDQAAFLVPQAEHPKAKTPKWDTVSSSHITDQNESHAVAGMTQGKVFLQNHMVKSVMYNVRKIDMYMCVFP